MQLLLAALGALACLASAKVSIIVDPSTTTTTVTVDTSAGCSAGAADGPDVDGPMGFVCKQSYKSDADAAQWVSYLDEWAPKAKELGVLEMKSVQTSGANAYLIFVFPNNAAWQAFDAYLGSDPNIPKIFSTISNQECHDWGAVSHKSRALIANWDSMPMITVQDTVADIALTGRPDVENAVQQIVEVGFPTPEGLQEMINAFNDPEIMGMLQAAGCTWVMWKTGPTTGLIYQSEPNPQAVMATIGSKVFGAKLGPIVGKMASILVHHFHQRAQITSDEQAVINGWRQAGVQFNDGYNVHGLGGAADGPLGFVNTIMYKSEADAARWISYLDEWAPMAKKMGALEMKAVQTSSSSGYFVMVFPSNAAWQAWNEYLATDSNIPEMFSTIAHMDAKVWGQPSHKSLQGIAAWGAMPNVVVSATSSAIAVAGRPDVEQAIQQIVEVAFPTPEGLQSMIDAFNDPEIMGMLQAAGCTWVFFETGANTGLIYQSEPNPQAFMDTIGNEAFGAKLGPIVGAMSSILVHNFHQRPNLTAKENAVLNGWQSAGVVFNHGYNVRGLGGETGGPMGLICTIQFKTDADAAHWVAYFDEFVAPAKEMGVLELKGVQTSGSSAYFILVVPNNAAWVAFDAHVRNDANVPKMFATIAHQDIKAWGNISPASLQLINNWGAMEVNTVSATTAAVAVVGTPDPENSYHQVVYCNFASPEGVQEMIDGFLDPEIYDVIVSTGSTWAVWRTGPTTVIIYQAEPNPQAVQDTIGNEAFGAKFGPIVAKMASIGADIFHKRKKLTKPEQDITDGWEKGGVNFNVGFNVHGM